MKKECKKIIKNMKDDECCCNDKMNWCKPRSYCGTGCGVYGLGFAGAVIYFTSKAATFGAVIVAILKSFVWPAYLVYYALKFLGL